MQVRMHLPMSHLTLRSDQQEGRALPANILLRHHTGCIPSGWVAGRCLSAMTSKKAATASILRPMRVVQNRQ
jgi:hypothetical protein